MNESKDEKKAAASAHATSMLLSKSAVGVAPPANVQPIGTVKPLHQIRLTAPADAIKFRPPVAELKSDFECTFVVEICG